MDWEWLREMAEAHRYKVLGGLGGLVFALLFIRFGWWALFILVCSGLGYWVGKRLDEGPESLFQLLERFLPPGGR
ncbi:MAG: DUF2273 domain-containing protein [Bacillota bacterium]